MNSIYVVLTNPVAGREQEFAEWYDKRHLFDVARIPGFSSASRYERVSETRAGDTDARHRSLAIYDLQGELRGALQSLTDAIAGGLEMSSAMDSDRESVAYEIVDSEGDWPATGAQLLKMIRSDAATNHPGGGSRPTHNQATMLDGVVAARHYVRAATQRVPGLESTPLFVSLYSIREGEQIAHDRHGGTFRLTARA